MLADDKYCPGCATPLVLKQAAGRQRPVCPECDRVVYYDPKVAATCIVAREGRVLMVCRGVQPGIGLWSIPGGYVDRGEVVEVAAVREVQEETGLDVEVVRLLGLFSEPGQPVIVAAFAARETGGVLTAGPETLDVGFFPTGSLPPLAFPRDQEILQLWMSR
jgi:ADP-ribose pyrophosphatase YjhB (NUDIX family)